MSNIPALVLIGPAATGKSTLGSLTATVLGLPFIDIDAVADPYYAEVGWSIDRLVERSAAVGRVAAEREWEPARAHAVARTVDEHPGAILALGAGHTSFTGNESLDRVRAALAPVPHVVLVLPDEGRATSLAELRRRSVLTKGTEWISGGHDFLAEWLDDPGTRALATSTLVTGAESPEQCAARLVRLVGTA